MLPIANSRIIIDTNLWVSYFLGYQTKDRLKQVLFDETVYSGESGVTGRNFNSIEPSQISQIFFFG